jgi:uncharacterized protein YqfB (UPF0267 family)
LVRRGLVRASAGPGRARSEVVAPTPGDVVSFTAIRHSVHSVEFSQELRADVLTGRITVSFRLWSRPKVKVGGRYRVEAGQIEVDSVELVPFSSIDDADLCRSGEADLESLRQRAAHAGPIHEDTLLYRIEFHLVD